MISKLLHFIIFATSLFANDIFYKPDEAKNLLLKNSTDFNIQKLIYVNDLLLIDIKGSSKKYSGRLLSIQDDFLFIEKKSFIKNSIIAIDINEIAAIHHGIDKTFKELRNQWGVAFSMMLLLGLYMGEQNQEPEIDEEGARMNTMNTMSIGGKLFFAYTGGYLFYGNIFGGVDYLIRKNKAQKYIIGNGDWVIDNNY
tara:strand:+ start:35 stop:625 length:591 start_codon:yes stop_codon:yes gene_type:complete